MHKEVAKKKNSGDHMAKAELKEQLSQEIFDLITRDKRYKDEIDIWDALGILESVKNKIFTKLDKNYPMWENSYLKKT